MAFKYYTTLSLKNRLFFRYCSRLYSSDAQVKVSEENDQPEIVIPYRIQRGPTDILKALASTLKKDHTAPNYKYEDDPYFIPASNITKRSFALSKESGKKAARYFLEKYPDIFKCNKSAPLVKAFEPPVLFGENDKVTEDILESCIDSLDVANCLTVYGRLNDEGVPLKKNTQQKLLELLCFYNSTVPPREEYYEERWFARRDNARPAKSWLGSGTAERLFQEMDKDSLSYCTMIQGATKYGDAQRAMLLYDEICEKNLPVTLEAYNSLLTIVHLIKEDGDLRWQHAMDLVKKMNSEGISPDLYTMNALMSIVADTRRWNKGRSMVMHILAEMDRLQIEPSLATYHYALLVFYRNYRGGGSILPKIMDRLEGKQLEIRHPMDTMFFHSAMEACRKVDMDKDMAYRINNLLELGNNCKLIGSAFWENIYFQNYFRLLCEVEDFDKFMELYEKYVPSTYTPEPAVTLDIIIALDFNGAYHHLTRICSDVILFEQSERENVLSELLRVSGSVKLEQKDQELLIKLVWSIMEKIDQRAEKSMRKTLQWTGLMMGNILKTCLNGNDLEKSWVMIQRLKQEEYSILGHVDNDCILLFCKRFLEAKEFEKVAFCIRYAEFTTNAMSETDLQEIVDDLVERDILSDDEKEEANTILKMVAERKNRKDFENSETVE